MKKLLLVLLISIFLIGIVQASIYEDCEVYGTCSDTKSTTTSSGGLGGNVTTFLNLTDTPADYTGDGGKCVAINVGEDGLEFVTCGTGGGNIFNQELNTTFNVTFDHLQLTGGLIVAKNVTASWYFGLFDWVISSSWTDYLSFNGSTLSISSFANNTWSINHTLETFTNWGEFWYNQTEYNFTQEVVNNYALGNNTKIYHDLFLNRTGAINYSLEYNFTQEVITNYGQWFYNHSEYNYTDEVVKNYDLGNNTKIYHDLFLNRTGATNYTLETFTNWGTYWYNQTEYNFTIETFNAYNSTWDNRGLIKNNTNIFSDLFVNITGDTMTGNLNVSANISVDGYYFGQPLAGSLDNGIIQSDEIDNNGNLNLTHTAGLDITYPNFKVRLVSTITLKEIYCDIPSDTISIPDNAHTAYFIDTNCDLQNVPVATFVDASLNNAGNVPVFHAMAHTGEIEVHQGLPIQNRIFMRSRILNFKTINLDVVSGLSLIEEEDLNFTINSGEYVFVDQAVDTSIQNLSNGAILEIFYRNGGDYAYDEYSGATQTGLNLSSCEDASQNLVECSNPTKYRRYFLFLTGYKDGDDDTEIHQRLARDDITYNNIGDCLNTQDNPLVYELPDIYTFTAVPLYAYCGQGTDTSFDGNFIDLRTVQSGSAGSDVDTSIFLTKDGTRPLTANWDVGLFNITADWFKGNFNWFINNSWSDYFSFNGSRLSISDWANDTWSANHTLLTFDQYNATWDNSLFGNTNHTADVFTQYNATWDSNGFNKFWYNQTEYNFTLETFTNWGQYWYNQTEYNFTSLTFDTYNSTWDQSLYGFTNHTADVFTQYNSTWDNKDLINLINSSLWIEQSDYITQRQELNVNITKNLSIGSAVIYEEGGSLIFR